MGDQIHLLITFGGILGAGLSAYVGVKVALAEIRTEMKRLDKIENRLDRLEEEIL